MAVEHIIDVSVPVRAPQRRRIDAGTVLEGLERTRRWARALAEQGCIRASHTEEDARARIAGPAGRARSCLEERVELARNVLATLETGGAAVGHGRERCKVN